MKRIFSVFIVCSIIAAGLTGCKKGPKAVTPIEGGGSRISDGTKPGPAIGTGMQGPGGSQPLRQGDPLNTTPLGQGGDPNESSKVGERPTGGVEDPTILQGQTIYFEFDKSTIRNNELPKLEQVATYLKNNPNARLKIAGNCDERGTEEYNRSLGERRALAALDHLVKQLGIDPARITTVSNGEDDPVDLGHDEPAWSKNRRDDFIVITP